MSVPSLRCAETFTQLGIGQRSPIGPSLLWLLLTQTAIFAHVEMESVAALMDWFVFTSGSALADGGGGAHGLYMYSCRFKILPVLYSWESSTHCNIRNYMQIEKKIERNAFHLLANWWKVFSLVFQAFCLFKLHVELSGLEGVFSNAVCTSVHGHASLLSVLSERCTDERKETIYWLYVGGYTSYQFQL